MVKKVIVWFGNETTLDAGETPKSLAKDAREGSLVFMSAPDYIMIEVNGKTVLKGKY
jgi:hypothetical protein